jgi:hypothetical protein
MRKRLHESKYFRLQQETNQNTGRRFSRIVWWDMFGLVEQADAVRDVVDPLRQRSGRNGASWKFTNRVEAERMYTMLLLRWA